MKILLREIILKNTKYEIYCDMDSVLSDFDSKFVSIADIKTKDGWSYSKKYGKERFWNIINTYGIKFWTEMPWMKDGKKLWSFLIMNFYKINILSAPSSHDNGESRRGKIQWISKHLGPVTVILEDDKYKYAAPNRILIDDMDKNIKPWIAAGGIGILHKSASDTISKIKKIVNNET